MKLLLLLVGACVCQGWNPGTWEEATFENWKKYYGKSYKSNESLKKLRWHKNVDLCLKHNDLARRGLTSFETEVNQFADQNSQDWEFGRPNVYVPIKFSQASNFQYFPQGVQLPDRIDWREWSYVTPVKDQGECGASWAFSAIGALEGQLFRKTGTLESLSEQQLIDCVNDNHGCSTGWTYKAFLHMKEGHGVVKNHDYPYNDQPEKQQCRLQAEQVVAKVTGYVQLPAGDEYALQKAVAIVGPVTAYIDASHHTFRSYMRGIYDAPMCSSEALSHAVLIVGYGTEKGIPYWLVKNSFGPRWGEDGYIRMSRNKNNQCGIASLAAYPLV